jgi:serine/threonine protein kinase, bacterial
MRHSGRKLFLALAVGLVAAMVPFGAKPAHAAPCLGPSGDPNGNGLEVYDCPSPAAQPPASNLLPKYPPCMIEQNAMRPCTPATAPTPKSVDTYAAVAISPSSLDTGVSWGAASEAQAEQLAVQYCAKQSNAKDCKSLEWTRDACLAIAVSRGTGHNDGTWGSAWNTNRSVAGAQAISACTTAKNKDCKIQESACSNGH